MDLAEFQREVGEWGRETFPNSTPETIAAHLKKEAKELKEAIDLRNGDEIWPVTEELADVFLLLLHLSHRYGLDLIEEGQKKFAVCKTRRWGDPDAEGVVEHIR